MVLTPGPLIPLHFGHVSFEPHLAEAAKLGLTPNILDDLPRVALDVDTPEDLAAALATGLNAGRGRLLMRMGLRLSSQKGKIKSSSAVRNFRAIFYDGYPFQPVQSGPKPCRR